MENPAVEIIDSHEIDAIFDAIIDNVALISPDFKILKANQATADHFRIPKKDLIGKKCHKCFQNIDTPCDECPVKISLSTGKKYVMEKHAAPTGTWLEISTYPVTDKENNLIGVIEHAKDITSIKKAEKQLVRNEKMEVLSVLAGGLVHDFNNLLQKIIFNVELISFKNKLDKESIEFIDSIKKYVSASGGIIRQLLSISKGLSAPLKPISVNSLIEEIISLVQTTPGKEISLEFVEKTECDIIEGDYVKMHQVILNLVLNSIDAIPRKGIVSFMTTTRGDGNLSVEITDTGVGIPESLLGKIFTPFFSTKETHSGLGLHSVKNIIDKHKGKIVFESKDGKGTKVKLLLPLSAKNIPISILF